MATRLVTSTSGTERPAANAELARFVALHLRIRPEVGGQGRFAFFRLRYRLTVVSESSPVRVWQVPVRGPPSRYLRTEFSLAQDPVAIA